MGTGNDQAGTTPTDTTTGANPGTQQQTAPQTQPAPQPTPPATGDDPLGAPGIEALRREREARATLASENSRLQAELRTLQDKDKPEEERNKARNAELESGIKDRDGTIRDLRIELAMTTAGAKLGIIDPGLAVMLMKQDNLLEFDADGKPTNVDAALKAILKDRPFLLKQPTGTPNPGPGGKPPTGDTDMNSRIRGAARRTTIET